MKLYLPIIVAVLGVLTPFKSYADDDVKRLIGGLAVGIVGQMIDNAEQNQQDQPVQNAQSGSEPKLEYSQDVADVQKKLKAVGYYDGAVDGLKGQNTIDSINMWESDYSVESGDGRVNAMLSPDEISLLDKQTESKQTLVADNDTSNEDRPKKISEMKGVKEQDALYRDIKGMVIYYKSGEACLDYKNQTGRFGKTAFSDKFNGQYRQYLDEDIEEYVTKAKSLEQTRFLERAQCNDISEQTLQGLYDRAEHEYKGSSLEINLTSAIAAIKQGYPDVEERFVDECNVYAHKLKKEYQKMVNEKQNECQ